MVDAAHTIGRALISAHGGVLQCVVVTPEATVTEVTATFIALPLFDGELGVAPGHSPMIGRLGFGELRITDTNDVTTRYYLDGGFVQVADNVVSILTGRAVLATEIDVKAADEQLQAAQHRPANTLELLAIRDRLIAQARAQRRVAKRR